MIVVTCTCGARFKAENEYAGRLSRCTKCGKSVRIPSTHSDALLADVRKPVASVEQLTSVEFTKQKTPDRLYLKCGGCGGRLSVRVTSVGRKGTCPHCQKKFIVPQPPPPDEPIPELDLAGAAIGAAGPASPGVEDLPTLEYADVPESPMLFTGGSSRARGGSDRGDSGALELAGSGEIRIEQSGVIAPPPRALPRGAPSAAPPGGETCPCCGGRLRAGAMICVACGINIKTGRSLVISQEDDLDEIYAIAETLINKFSWLIWTGLFPIASEAFGGKKPFVVRGLVLATIVISMIFLVADWTNSRRMRTLKNLMLWPSAPPPAEMIRMYYDLTNYGDAEAFFDRYVELARQHAAATSQPAETGAGDSPPASSAAASTNAAAPAAADSAPAPPADAAGNGAASDEQLDTTDASEDFLENLDYDNDELILAAYRSLEPAQRCLGEFRWWQMLTHQFLHGGLMHLFGNMIFFWVFGSRINALVGNLMTAILYPLLGVMAALSDLWSADNIAGQPSLGASGAIMGLAGMYFILFPLNKVHMAAWLRLGLAFGFRLKLWLFAVRGVWVVLFYIAFDVLAVFLKSDDGTGHYAHLGGFVVGAIVALALLMARLINARGGDLVTVILGKRAWALIGKPNRIA